MGRKSFFSTLAGFNLEFLEICKFMSSTTIVFCNSNGFRWTHGSRNQSKYICREAEKLCHRLGRQFRFSKICLKVDAGDRFRLLSCSWVLAGANFIACGAGMKFIPAIYLLKIKYAVPHWSFFHVVECILDAVRFGFGSCMRFFMCFV